MLATVDTGALVELIWVGPLAALCVALTFGVFIWGTARAGDARRDGNGAAATGYFALAVLAGLLFAALIVAAMWIITAKD